MRLITIPQSHYVEKARWALDLARVAYKEEPHLPLAHLLHTLPRGGRTVPMLVQGLGVLRDSTDVLLHLDQHFGGGFLYPTGPTRESVVFLEDHFDTKLGPQVRRWAFAHLLGYSSLLKPMMARGVPTAERAFLPIVLPLVRWILRSRMHVDPANVERYRDRIGAIFAEVDERVHDGRRFMVGNTISAADIAFCSLAAPALFPPGYCGALPALEEAPRAMREDVLAFRQTAAGRYALRLFEEERRPK